jgi:FMN phosphatase YigB (HAD superfamily)
VATIKAVVTDLDNTLYDWVDYYVPSFLAMVEELSRLTGLDVEALKAAFKRIHEKHRTTEYSFAVEELDVLRPFNEGLSQKQILQKYETAIRAFRQVRKRSLTLYPGVERTLENLRNRGITIAAATEAMSFHAIYRLKQLGIEDYFAAIVCPPDHGLPTGLTYEDVRFYDDPSKYETSISLVVHPPRNVRKPDPQFLETLLVEMSLRPEEVLYVGDSITKDILLARRSGTYDALAEYGRHIQPEKFAELLKITYWTEEDLLLEGRLKGEAVTPRFTLTKADDIITVVDSIQRCYARTISR